ncbi:MAG: molybdopterin molybdotransferase MoeA [Symploca sp. SIO3C6]|nr:molybdopterin molybdotransferase MoeA [Symploca sp. SIO3C6]
MLPVKQAESIILNLVQPFDGKSDTETVELSAANGRILAKQVTSQLDFPQWDNSAMDGYAVRYADIQAGSLQQPAVLEIVEEIPAGYQPQVSIQQGQAARIFTGACMPIGADTVVMQEQTRRENDRVLILEAPEPQAFVRRRASFYQAGMPLLEPGVPLRAPEMAVLAAAQCTQLSVYRRPRVAIFSTGNELITPEQPLELGKIVDSNQYALRAFVAQAGGIPLPLPIVRDQPEKLEEAITKAISSADMVLSTGGVSVGDYDYVEQILAKLGAEIHIHKVAIKPGKPLTVATFALTAQENGGKGKRSILYFGLPGNPVSALVSCWRFVQPAILKLSGLPQEAWGPCFVRAHTLTQLHSGGNRETYIWGQLHLKDGAYEFSAAGGSHASSNLINLAQTNGLAVLPIGQTSVPAGGIVQVLQVVSPV